MNDDVYNDVCCFPSQPDAVLFLAHRLQPNNLLISENRKCRSRGQRQPTPLRAGRVNMDRL